MDLSKKKLKLSRQDLRRLREFALDNFKELAPSPWMDEDAFKAYCWFRASVQYLSSKGIDVPDTEIKRD